MRISNSLLDLRRPLRKKWPRSIIAAVIAAGFDPATIGTGVMLSENNFRMTSSAGDTAARSITSFTTKKYFEIEMVVKTGGAGIGVCQAVESFTTWVGSSDKSAGLDTDGGIFYTSSNSVGATGTGEILAGDVVGVAVDQPNRKIWFSKNGVFASGQDPVAGTGGFTTPTGAMFAFTSVGNTGSHRIRTQSSQFLTQPPSGYTALV